MSKNRYLFEDILYPICYAYFSEIIAPTVQRERTLCPKISVCKRPLPSGILSLRHYRRPFRHPQYVAKKINFPKPPPTNIRDKEDAHTHTPPHTHYAHAVGNKKIKKNHKRSQRKKYPKQQKIKQMEGVGKGNGHHEGTGIYLCSTHAVIRKTAHCLIGRYLSLAIHVRACARQQCFLTCVMTGGGISGFL